jgi:hypothetical protein
MIVARFGTAARVLADRFISSEQDRELLVDVVDGVSLRESHTDVAGLEDLIAGIRAGLTKRFARQGFRLKVEIFTDGRPDPGKGTGNRPLPQTFERLLGQSPSKTSLGDGLLLLGLVFDQPSALALVARPDSTAKPAATLVPTVHMTLDARPPLKTVSLPRNWQYGGLALIPIVIGIVLWVRLRRSTLEADGLEQAADAAAPESASVLVVTETQTVASGESRVVRERERIAVVPGAPVIVGSNPASCTLLVAPVPGAEDAELFRVIPTVSGCLTLTAIPGALCDGHPVPRRGYRRAGDRPMRVQIADREWMIRLDSDDGSLAAVDDLFARVTRKGTADDAGPEKPGTTGA